NEHQQHQKRIHENGAALRGEVRRSGHGFAFGSAGLAGASTVPPPPPSRPFSASAFGGGRNRLGLVGSGGTSSGSSGCTSRGVISTINSVRSIRSDLLLKKLPMIGRRLKIGTSAEDSCVRLSSRPAITNDWPSRSSTSVSARRVDSAGIRKPDKVMPLP